MRRARLASTSPAPHEVRHHRAFALHLDGPPLRDLEPDLAAEPRRHLGRHVDPSRNAVRLHPTRHVHRIAPEGGCRPNILLNVRSCSQIIDLLPQRTTKVALGAGRSATQSLATRGPDRTSSAVSWKTSIGHDDGDDGWLGYRARTRDLVTSSRTSSSPASCAGQRTTTHADGPAVRPYDQGSSLDFSISKPKAAPGSGSLPGRGDADPLESTARARARRRLTQRGGAPRRR